MLLYIITWEISKAVESFYLYVIREKFDYLSIFYSKVLKVKGFMKKS